MSDADNGFVLDLDEEAVKEINRRLAMANAPDAPGAAPAQRAEVLAPKQEKAASPPPHSKDAPVSSMGFLAELELEVARQKSLAPAKVAGDANLINDGLARIFSFFNKMAHYSNELEPEISRVYRLDARTEYAGLHWHGAYADYRKQNLSEKAYLSNVSFRARLFASRNVPVTRRWDMMAALRKDLSILDLRAIDDEVFATRPEQEYQTIELASDFPVQIVFHGNYEEQKIEVVSRNFEGFGISAFELDPAKAGEAFLDKLGRFLLARSNRLPEELVRVNYKKSA